MKLFVLWAVIFSVSHVFPDIGVSFMLGSISGIFWKAWYDS